MIGQDIRRSGDWSRIRGNRAAHKVGKLNNYVGKVCVRKVIYRGHRGGEICPTQICAPKVAVSDVGVGEVRTAQVRPTEVNGVQVGIREVNTRQVSTGPAGVLHGGRFQPSTGK